MGVAFGLSFIEHGHLSGILDSELPWSQEQVYNKKDGETSAISVAEMIVFRLNFPSISLVLIP